MTARKSLYFGFVLASVVNVVVFIGLALGVVFQSDWATVQFTTGIYYWPLATIAFLLQGLIVGRVFWDWQHPPYPERLGEIRTQAAADLPAL